MFQCDDSGRHYRKHPVMPFSSRYSIPGFWTRDSPYLLHVDSFARSFRLLVTFALVLDVRGIPFFQILWTAYGRCSSLIERSQSECSRWVLDSTLWLCQFYLSAWVIRKKCWALLDILIYASTTQKVICSLELSLFICFLTIVCQLIVRSMCAFVFIDAFYSCGPSSHSIAEWLGETNSRTSSISRIGSKSCAP